MADVVDNEFYIRNFTDDSKAVRFDLSASTTNTISTLIVPPTSGGSYNLPLLETANTWAGAQSFVDMRMNIDNASIVMSGDLAIGDVAFAVIQDTMGPGTLVLIANQAGLVNSSKQYFQDKGGSLVLSGFDSTPPTFNGGMSRVDLTAQSANVGSTNLTKSVGPGMYRVTAYLEGTTIGTGTLTVNLAWTDDVGATTDSGLTFLLTGTGRASRTVPLYLASGEISYSTSGYLTGAYALRIRVESLA